MSIEKTQSTRWDKLGETLCTSLQFDNDPARSCGGGGGGKRTNVVVAAALCVKR